MMISYSYTGEYKLSEDKTMTVKIGKRIKELRKKYDVTQDRLADVLGVTSQAVSKWENETGYPDIEYITPIANFFNVTIDELFGHDNAEKVRKVEEYCKKHDDMELEWMPVDERIGVIRQALAEYPGEEKLLVRLATALWYKWQEGDFYSYTMVDGKVVSDPEKYRAREGWEEPVKIMEELLATSVDDEIRAGCRDILPYIYGAIGEKEKVYKIADYCPNCRHEVLYSALCMNYEEEARISSQHLLMKGLHLMQVHLPMQTWDNELRLKAYEQIVGMYSLIFNDGNYQFYHAKVENVYISIASLYIRAGRHDEAIDALEQAYDHAVQFDVYLDKLRTEGEIKYTSVFMDSFIDKNEDVHAAKLVPEFLRCVLLDEQDEYFRNLKGNPRYEALIERVKKDIG